MAGPILSSDSQKQVADRADAAEKHARGRARRHFKWSVGLFGAGVLISAMFPPAALPGLLSLVAVTAGIVTTAYGVGHRLNANMAAEVKKEAGEPDFAEKMKARAERLGNMFRRADKISDRTLYGALGLAAVAWLAPVTAPVVWGIYSIVVTAMAAATLVRAVSRDASRTAGSFNDLTQELVRRDAATPPVVPPPAALPASPAPDFDKAVKGPVPAADATPVPVPPPPKP